MTVKDMLGERFPKELIVEMVMNNPKAMERAKEYNDALKELGSLETGYEELSEEALRETIIVHNSQPLGAISLAQAICQKFGRVEIDEEKIIDELNETQSEGINEIQYGSTLDKQELAKAIKQALES